MRYVIRRKEDGLYAKGGPWWNRVWMEDLQSARVYPSVRAAKGSLRKSFARGDHSYRASDEDMAKYDVVEVAIVEVGTGGNP